MLFRQSTSAIRSACSRIPNARAQQQVRFLNIHEYQAKELMTKYNVAHQRGKIVKDVNEVESVCKQVQEEFGTQNLILKAQIMAGGRGKGVFNTGYKGGVKFCPR